MSNTPQRAGGPPHSAERRSYARKIPRTLTYIELGTDNGGIVLNMSEGGLSLAAAGFISGDPAPSLRFRFSGSKEWVETRGEIAWTSQSKKEAGIKFIDLEEDASNRIRDWISMEASQDRSERTPHAIPEQHEAPRVAPNARNVFPAPVISRNSFPDQSHVSVSKPSMPESPGNAGIRVPVFTSVSSTAKPSREVHLPVSKLPADPPAQRDGQLRVWLISISLLALIAIVSFALGMAEGRGAWSEILGINGSKKPIANEQENRPTPAPPAVRTSTPSLPVENPPPTVPKLAPREASHIPPPPPREIRRSEPAIVPAPPGQSASAAPNPVSERVNELPVLVPEAVPEPVPEAVKVPSPTVKPPEMPVIPTGSIEIISDPYPSIRVPPEWKARASRPGASLMIGHLMSKVEPQYPQDALRQRIAGAVKSHIVIGRDGSVQKAQLTDGPRLLAEAALRAVQQWRYEPTLLGGEAIEVEEDVTMVFRLVNPPTP